MQDLITVLMILLTLGAYLFSRNLYLRYHSPLLNVVVISSALVIAALLIFHVPYEMYRPGKDLISILLGPTTVCLAVPLYNNRAVLKKHLVLIISGVCLASSLTSLTAMSIVQLLGLPKDVVISIGPKSATAPIAAEVAKVNGGDPGLAIAFVIATGTIGAIFGPTLLTLLKVTSPMIRGLAMGTVSHGQGTAVALLEGEQQGLMAGIGMALSALVTSSIVPIIVPILLSY
jgi:predicted murein hydrolase (TIGR00659 family)